jgi:hypothetical protein
MRFVVSVAIFPNAPNHLQTILPNKILKSKKNPQVRFPSLAAFYTLEILFVKVDIKCAHLDKKNKRKEMY